MKYNIALDSNKSRWITIHPNGKKHKGRACKIAPETGKIKGGNIPTHFYNKPLNKAFNSNKEVHHFSLHNEPLVTKANLRPTFNLRKLTPEKLQAANIQGRQILKANPLPDCFTTQKQGVKHIQALLPNTSLYLDLLSKESLHSIASAIHVAAKDFPHILTTSVYELGHFDHKFNEFQKQKTQRMAIINQLYNDKEWKNKLATKLNAEINNIKAGLEHLPDAKKLPYLCRFTKVFGKDESWVNKHLKDATFFKEFSKMSIKMARNEELKRRLENTGLISAAPQQLQKYSAVFEVNTKSIALNSKHFYCLGDFFLSNEYEKSVTTGRLSKLKLGVNVKTAIVLHELMHALDYSYSLNTKSISDLKYFNEMFENAKSGEYSKTNHKFDNIHEFFQSRRILIFNRLVVK